jgi:hypothetical protein
VWIDVGDSWLEARSSAPGLLGNARLPRGAPPPDSEARRGVLSVVTDDDWKRTRDLPTLFVARQRVFSHRKVDEVLRRLERTVDVVVSAREQPTYALQPCELSGRRGLYGRDLYNRAPYRRHLARLGAMFADDQYVRLTARGTFQCDSWGEFTPAFVILRGDPDDPQKVVRQTGAQLVWRIATFRVGKMSPSEVRLIASRIRQLHAAGAEDPAALVAALTSDER